MKVLASDYDGTLYFKYENPSIRTKDVEKIKEFQKQGNLFGMCTGRGYYAVLERCPLDLVNFDFYILESGAHLLDKNRHILYADPWPVDLVYEISERYGNRADCVMLHTGDGYLEYKHHHYEQYKHIYSKEEIPDNVYSVVFLYPYNESILDLAKDIGEHYPMIAPYPNVVSVDMALKGNSKGTGIHKMKEFLHADIMAAIGDSFNDIPAIDAADVAFGIKEGASELHAHCDYVVDSIADAIDILMEDEYENSSK